MGGPCGGPFCVGRELPMREDFLAALVQPGDGGIECVCLLLGRRASVGELPLQAFGPSLEEA